MANIGTFTKTGNEYKGEIVTMSVQQKNVRIVPEVSDNENAPSHRVFVGRAEIGAANGRSEISTTPTATFWTWLTR